MDLRENTEANIVTASSHELSLAGILAAICSIAQYEGLVNILVRNKPALTTILSTKHGTNAHYSVTANRELLQWLSNSNTNEIHWGWCPASYTHPILQTLGQQIGKLQRRGHTPLHPSAATARRMTKEELRNQSKQYYQTNLGAHFPDLGPSYDSLTTVTTSHSRNLSNSCPTTP